MREWTRVSPGCPRVIGTHFQMFERGLESLGDLHEWSGGHLDVRERSVGPPGGPGVVGRHARMSGRGRDALRDL